MPRPRATNSARRSRAAAWAASSRRPTPCSAASSRSRRRCRSTRLAAPVPARDPDHRAARAPLDRPGARRRHRPDRRAVLRDAQDRRAVRSSSSSAAPASRSTERLALVPHIVAAAHAIAHAHERGIVHRDIKPVEHPRRRSRRDDRDRLGPREGDRRGRRGSARPIRVDPSDSLKTRAGIVYGTPGFMAPEQLRGHPVDRALRRLRARRDALPPAVAQATAPREDRRRR